MLVVEMEKGGEILKNQANGNQPDLESGGNWGINKDL